MRNYLFAGAAAVAIMAPFAAVAQETTSSIRGTVTAEGVPVVGAPVVVTHVPSGTRTTVTTDASGSFNVTGQRVGGPFTVSVDDGAAQVTDIFTVVGQSYEVPITIAAAGDEIVVTAARLQGAGSVSQGPATVLGVEEIANVASISRDIRDLARRDPFARLDDNPTGGRAVSFAGQNARFNRFSVDGVAVTDNFGLNPDGLPSRRSPIPLDAIGQFQTKVAPFDVREGNFQGGSINIVLRSGGNDFQGTGFYSYSSDKLTGDKTKEQRVTLPKFKSEDYGVQLSGPIIKDKLFFMVAAERIRAGTPIPEGTIENNAGSPVPGLSQAQVDQITSIAQTRYGYAAGGILNNSQDEDDRVVAKLDANISDTQRASLTYSYTKDSIRFNQNTFVTPPPGLGLESNGYTSSNRLHTGVFQLNSDWSDEFSTEARGFYKDYKRGQDPILGRGFAQFRVCTAPTSDRAGGPPTSSTLATNCPVGFSQVSLGPDSSRQSNALSTNTFGGLFQARLKRNDHDLRVFAVYQQAEIVNLFLQNTAGNYYFDSIADFQAKNAQRLVYQNAIPSLDPNDAAATFGYQAYTFGIQDNWRVNDMLSVSFGARYDMYGGKSRSALNSNFVARYGFANNAFINGRGVFQPRIGFNFEPTDRLSLRGGVGIFAGGNPDVYVSNSFATTGVLSNSITINQNNNGTFSVPAAVGTAALVNVDGTTIPAAVDQFLLNGTVAATSPVNALDPNFKLPSQWRATLSADYEADLGPLGDGWRVGADFLYSAVRNQVFFTDLRVRPNGTLTPDGRPRYSPVTTFTDNNTDIFLTNTKRGRSYVAVARVDKEWDFGLGIGGSFTYQDVKDQAPATSSTAGSNYLNGAFLDPNRVEYGTSNDQVKYLFKYRVDFSRAFFGDYKTTFALFGESRVGHPFNYTFLDPTANRSSVFGTNGSGTGGTSGLRYLLYVPTIGGDTRVSYDTLATQTAFEGLVNSTGLKNFQGRTPPRNAFRSKAFTKLDLHLEQEIPVPGWSQARISLFADIENVGNMIKSSWGQVREYTFPYNAAAVRVQCLIERVPTNTAPTAAQVATTSSQACLQYRYSSFTQPTDQVYTRQSLYAIRVGARFSF